MTEHNLYDSYQRRQICDHITTLKSKCENLTRIKDDLSNRLNQLNLVVDQLIAEKNSKFKSGISDSVNVEKLKEKPDSHNHNPTSKYSRPLATSSSNPDLNHKFSSTASSQRGQRCPSNAFKIKLSLCLQEISPKVDEIVELSEQL